MKENKINKILEIIIKEFDPKKVILFGSRGKGISSSNSDYDIAIDSNRVDFRTKRKFLEKIDKIIGLHKIDLVYLNDVEKSFKSIILNTGKIIYER